MALALSILINYTTTLHKPMCMPSHSLFYNTIYGMKSSNFWKEGKQKVLTFIENLLGPGELKFLISCNPHNLGKQIFTIL